MLKTIFELYGQLAVKAKLLSWVSLIVTFIVAALSVSYPLFFSFIVQKFVEQDFNTFFALLIITIFIHVLNKVLSEARWFLLSKIETKLASTLKLRYITKILQVSPSFISKHGAGKIQGIFKRCDSAIFAVSRHLYFTLIPTILQLIFLFILVLYKFPLIYLVLIAITILSYIGITIVGSKILDEFQKRFLVHEDSLLNNISNTIWSRALIRLFNYEQQQIIKFQSSLLDVEKESIAMLNRRGVFGIIHAVAGAVTISIILFYSAIDLTSHIIDISAFIFINMSIFQIIAPMDNLSKVYRELKLNLLNLEHGERLLEEEMALSFGVATLSEKTKNNPNIEFKNVSFIYPNRSDFALENVSFKISNKQIVGIIGESGSGKSTIIALLTRIYNPTSGEIWINGIKIQEYSKEALFDLFSVAPQQNLLLDETIKNNILMGGGKVSDELLKDLSEKTTVDQFVKKLKGKYDYVVGNNEKGLSEGQAQRINLTRSLVHNKPILLLDEVTSALDNNTEKLVLNNVHHLLSDRLTIFVSHKLSSLKDADVILVFDKGKLIKKIKGKTSRKNNI